MTDATNEDVATAPVDWPLRPWVLAGLLGLAGLLIHFVTQGNDDVPWQMATAAFLFFGAIAAAFTIEESRWKEPAVFAVGVGLGMAGLAWRARQYGEGGRGERYGVAGGGVADGPARRRAQARDPRYRHAT